MKYNCAKEFDLKVIYQKLTSTAHCVQTVPANKFFTKKTELEMLQDKMNKLEMLATQHA